MSIYTDQLHRKIELKQVPQRIISLVPSQTELLFDLEVGQNVVGITNYCVHPKQGVKQITKLGGTKNFDVDKIIALKPDLIIANKEENDRERIELLAQKFPIWISDVNDLYSAYQMITSIGEIVQKQDKAKEIVCLLSKNFTDFRENNSLLEKYQTLYFIWKDPFMVAGKDTFITHILSQSILKNCIYQNRYPVLEAEQIKKINPQLILLSSEPYPFKEKHIQEFAQLVPNAYIRVVDGELFSWYGSRLLHTLEYLQKLQTEIKLHFNKIEYKDKLE